LAEAPNPDATTIDALERERSTFRRAIAEALRIALPGARIVAEGFLAEVSSIDWLAVGERGELISIRFTERGDDAAGLTRALADLSWLRPRRIDFLKLAPGLGIDPSAEPRALLVCSEFGAETRAAADNLPLDAIALWRCRAAGADARSTVVLDAVSTGAGRTGATRDAPAASGTPPALRPELRTSDLLRPPPRLPGAGAPARPGARGRERSIPLTAPPSASAFRTGLLDTDLEQPAGDARRPSSAP